VTSLSLPGVPTWSVPQAPKAWVAGHRQALSAVGLALVAAIAYRLTFVTMMANLGLDTPLAYLPLMPFIALGLGLLVIHRHRDVPPPARDRIVDTVVGVPLLILALFLVTIVPAVSSTYYWSDRPDVLSLACFATGGVILIFGLGWFWRLRWPLVFLLLAWPALYLRFLTRLLLEFTDVTNGILAAIVPHLPIGVTSGAAAGSLVVQQAHGAPITVSVSTACAGADGVLAFALIGGAFLTTRAGGAGRRVLWLLTGMLFAFTMNLVRITSVLALVSLGHPGFALGAYHAVIGLVIFTIVVGLMALLTKPFGLRTPEDLPAQKPSRPARALSWRVRALITATLSAFSILVGIADASLAPYAAFADGTGAPTVARFTTSAAPASWSVSHVADYPWAAQYFGKSSTFERFAVRDNRAHFVYADVVRTKSRSALAAYNVQNCFLFHRYKVTSNERTDLGNGVTGLLLSYTVDGTGAKWSTASWAWPVRYNGQTYYERILLTASTAALTSAAPSAAPPAPSRPVASPEGWVFRLIGQVTGQVSPANKVQTAANTSLQRIAIDLVAATLRERTA
jgi:exosortase/archaeosortase family protein